jgi:hypothetical protein
MFGQAKHVSAQYIDRITSGRAQGDVGGMQLDKKNFLSNYTRKKK